MPHIDDGTRLRHIIDAAKKALSFTKGLSRSTLDTDEKLALALVRLLEIIGEAATQISQETKNQQPEIPWKKIIGMRNQLIHGYSQVNLDILWQTVKGDLPPLVETLEKILDDLKQQGRLF